MATYSEIKYYLILVSSKIKASKITLHIVVEDWMKKLSPTTAVQAVVEAVILASYSFHKFKSSSSSETVTIEEVVLSAAPARLSAAEEGLRSVHRIHRRRFK